MGLAAIGVLAIGELPDDAAPEATPPRLLTLLGAGM